jgi:hypothetical protein
MHLLRHDDNPEFDMIPFDMIYAMICKGIDDCLHREPINSISWLRDVRDNTYYIVSIAGDGKVIISSFRSFCCLLLPSRCTTPLTD